MRSGAHSLYVAVTVLPVQVPIPQSFYAAGTEAPFEQCLVCNRRLLDESTEYLIEKGYRYYDDYDVTETVFGYALCLDCQATINRSFSTLSKQRCQDYLSERIDLSARAATLLGADSPDLDRWIDHCIVHDTPKEALHEYQILALCHGESMLLTHLPLLIGGPALDELTQRLSNETLDELGGFRNEYFGLPPEMKQDLQGPILV